MNFLCKLTIVIPSFPCQFSLAKGNESAVVHDNLETSDFLTLCKFAMCTFARKRFPIEQVSCSDGLQRTWWRTIHMMPGLLAISIPMFKYIYPEDTCFELFQPIGCFEPTFIDAYQVWRIICNIRMLKSRTMTHCILEEIITSSNEQLKDWEFNMVGGIWSLRNSSWETIKSCVMNK